MLHLLHVLKTDDRQRLRGWRLLNGSRHCHCSDITVSSHILEKYKLLSWEDLMQNKNLCQVFTIINDSVLFWFMSSIFSHILACPSKYVEGNGNKYKPYSYRPLHNGYGLKNIFLNC